MLVFGVSFKANSMLYLVLPSHSHTTLQNLQVPVIPTAFIKFNPSPDRSCCSWASSHCSSINPLLPGFSQALEPSRVHREGHWECSRSRTEPGGAASLAGEALPTCLVTAPWADYSGTSQNQQLLTQVCGQRIHRAPDRVLGNCTGSWGVKVRHLWCSHLVWEQCKPSLFQPNIPRAFLEGSTGNRDSRGGERSQDRKRLCFLFLCSREDSWSVHPAFQKSHQQATWSDPCGMWANFWTEDML